MTTAVETKEVWFAEARHVCIPARQWMNDPKNSWAFLPECPRIISGVNTFSIITLSSYKSWLPFPYRQDKTLYFQ